MCKGFIDAPASEDKFEIKNYIDGISKFILTCNTPMTMSIQGDWGTGKTSIMELVKSKIENEVSDIIWFNTWQFSQFNMGDKLPFFLLNKLINEVADNQIELKEKSLSIVKNLFEIGTSVLTGGITNGKFITDVIDNNVIEKIEKLKSTFEKLIQNKVGENGRVVIFVDDLDRLEPKKAIELLEVLKIFLDCKNCIFVLAIDYSVVVSGVKDKYGLNFDAEKGKSFFDKIIQVAFKMPIANYNINHYIDKNLKDIDINVQDEYTLDKYVSLIRHSIGNNPRAMKRLFNSFYLLLCIADNDVIKTEDDILMLFSMLCMQSKYEELYNIILENKVDIDVEFINSLKNPESNLIQNLKLKEDEIEDIICFIQAVYSLIDKDDNQEINEDELVTFKKVLNFSGMTNASSDQSLSNNLWEYRELHKKIVRDYIGRLKNDTGVVFWEWKRKKYDVGNYYLYYNNWEDDNSKIKKVGFQFCFIPVEKQNKSRLDIEIYRCGNTNINDVKSIFGDNPLDILNVNPEYDENAISYRKVFTFDKNQNIDDIYGIVRDCSEKLLKYFV